MTCSQCEGIELEFGEAEAEGQLEAYLEEGPSETTAALIDALTADDVAGYTLLDIGGGVGSIQHALLEAGADSATAVDASSAYVRTARAEAERRGYGERIRNQHADFVEIAGQLPQFDIVTLDRVICCYHDLESLVGLSASRARVAYGLVYPRVAIWTRAAAIVGNLWYRIIRNPFRVFIHSNEDITAAIERQGLTRTFHQQDWLWQVAVYTRP